MSYKITEKKLRTKCSEIRLVILAIDCCGREVIDDFACSGVPHSE